MKHGSLISPEEATFGFGNAKAVFEATSATHSASHGGATDCITVPDAHFLFTANSSGPAPISRSSGKTASLLVPGYFKNEKLPTLLSPEGAALTGDVVEALAGSVAPDQYAQAGSAGRSPQPIGRVASVRATPRWCATAWP